jgi:hypothetical protein
VGQGTLFSQNSNLQWNEQWKKEDAQLLHTIQSELKPLLDQHISQSQFDDEYVQKAALRFLNLLDPEKRYLLSVEVDPFFFLIGYL